MRLTTNETELSILQNGSQVSLLDDSQRQNATASTRFASIDVLRNWFPEVDPDANIRSKRFSDRYVALLLIQSLSTAVLAFNLAITLWAVLKFGARDNVSDIIGARNGGDCDTVKIWNRWLHFGINALSTLLLGASNYCAQLLIAPSRYDVDNAHKRKRWLDLGIQSFRNLRAAGLKRQILWITLILSSGLLHLFWNSAVFAANPFSTYSIGYVTADFMDDQQPWLYPISPDLISIQNNVSSIQPITKAECIDRYAGRISGLSSLLLVSANVTMNDRLSYEQGNPGSSLLFNDTTVHRPIFWRMNSDWMCSAWSSYGSPSSVSCTPKVLKPRVETWTLARFETTGNLWAKVDYCLPLDDLRNMDDKCVLRISKLIFGLVTILNFAKCVCIAFTVHIHTPISVTSSTFTEFLKAVHRKDRKFITTEISYLVTVGDAIASFLQREDVYTQSHMFASKNDFAKEWPSHVNYSFPWPASIYWFRAASLGRWLVTTLSCAATIGVVSGLLYMTVTAQQDQGVDTDIASLWSYGLGTPQQWAVALTGVTEKLGPSKGLLFSVLFANMFQVIVSALYLLYNNLLTVMVVAAEWNDFISERKTLRLSVPNGIQRSAYFLSLPYKYSVTLMILSGLLHWFISQSVFVVQTVAYLPKYMPQEFERAPYLDASCIGFSSIGVILALSVGGTLVLFLFFVGFTFKYKARRVGKGKQKAPYTMPVVSTCSAAISANCQKHPEDVDCHLLPLQWGFVKYEKDARGGRFTFTTDANVYYPLWNVGGEV